MSRKWIVLVLLFCTVYELSATSNPLRLAENLARKLNHDSRANELEKKKNFFSNPLLLDGISLNYLLFSINSHGKLAMVEGNPDSPEAVRIPFRIYLKRNGVLLRKGKIHREIIEIEIAEVLAFARVGDDLVIEPTREEDAVAKRTIRLQNYWFLKFLGLPRSSGC